MRLEALVAVEGGSVCREPLSRTARGSDLLEGDAILGYAVEAILPHERDVAGISSLQPP